MAQLLANIPLVTWLPLMAWPLSKAKKKTKKKTTTRISILPRNPNLGAMKDWVKHPAVLINRQVLVHTDLVERMPGWNTFRFWHRRSPLSECPSVRSFALFYCDFNRSCPGIATEENKASSCYGLTRHTSFVLEFDLHIQRKFEPRGRLNSVVIS